jgi:iron(III) transport system substrate-binding protein
MLRRTHLIALLALLALSAVVMAACGGSDDTTAEEAATATDASGTTLVVYSGREEELVGPLYAKFTEDTGIELEVRYGKSGELAAVLMEEGDASPADVFYSQTSGDIGAVGSMLAPLPQADLDLVEPAYRGPDGTWVGVTGRVRVLAYNTGDVTDAELPASVLELASPDWAYGPIGVAPTNASFIAFVGALRLSLGDEATQAFLDGLAKNAKTYEKNGLIIDAIASGEISTGLVNHYYLYEKLGGDLPADAPVANHFFSPEDIGSLNNVSAVGMLKTAKHTAEAEQFIRYLLTEGQVYFTERTREYPMNASQPGTDRAKELPPLPATGPAVDLNELARDLPTTVQMIDKAGLVV